MRYQWALFAFSASKNTASADRPLLLGDSIVFKVADDAGSFNVMYRSYEQLAYFEAEILEEILMVIDEFFPHCVFPLRVLPRKNSEALESAEVCFLSGPTRPSMMYVSLQ